jgi:hypothetical protein
MDLSKLSSVTLQDSNGVAQNMGDLWADRPVVLAFLRHFG